MTAYEKISAARKSEIADDAAMLRAAVELTRDISSARAGIYWPDCFLSAALGYAALAGGYLADPAAGGGLRRGRGAGAL